MDTVEQLNGTYFYKGVCNISAGELFFWIMLDAVDEQCGGINDLVAMSCIILGQPVLKTRGKLGGTTTGTSIVSKFSRDYLNINLPVRLPTITEASLEVLKPMWVNNLGAFVGRTVPFLGWVLLANDLAQIVYNTVRKYNVIAREEDRIW